MPIPQDILSVPRPKNSIVIAYGKDKSLYAVRQRIGCRRENGRNLPINGPTIGHIIDGVYVPNDADALPGISVSPIDLKDWANIVLCDRLFGDIKQELTAVYNPVDAMKIYCISILRVCEPGIKNYELKEAYETGFLSELYPGAALSKNTVSTFLNDLGKTVSRIVRFMQNRTSAVSMDHHLLVDGTLKSDESKVNCYAAFYRSYRLQEYGKLKSHFPIYWLFVRAVFYSTFFIPYQRVSDIKIMSHIDVCHGFRYFCIKKQRKNSTFHSRLFLCPARHSTKETATKAMIRKKLLNFKLKLPFFVSDNELERFRASAVPFRERCPFCGARGNCRFYASYERSIVDIVDGKPCWRILKVVRILCACGHTHALLPDFVVPYKQYTLLFILHILHLYFSHSMTVQKLCDTFWISPPTLYEWKRAFALHRSWWPEFVRSGRKDSLDAIIFFLSRPVFSDFTSGFWQQTLFSFLQTHANPANCCRLPPGW